MEGVGGRGGWEGGWKGGWVGGCECGCAAGWVRVRVGEWVGGWGDWFSGWVDEWGGWVGRVRDVYERKKTNRPRGNLKLRTVEKQRLEVEVTENVRNGLRYMLKK